ncbi:MAG: hypothetical protein V8T45_11470 [Oscillospiraceae bacterium]
MEQSKLPHDHGQSAGEVMEHCPSAADFQEVSQLLRQLDDSTRVKLFWILCHCEECVMIHRHDGYEQSCRLPPPAPA